jgi:hypothetical protein
MSRLQEISSYSPVDSRGNAVEVHQARRHVSQHLTTVHPCRGARCRPHRCRSSKPPLQRLFHGLYVRSGSKIGVHQMAAAALHISPPGSFASHETAAALWGAAVGDLNEVHVSVPKGSSRSERRGIAAHRATTDQNPRLHRGLLVSDPTRVFLELAAARKDLVDLVALGDSLVRHKRTTPEDLVAAAEGYTGKGARLARRAASYIRSGVDSLTESRLRMLIVLGGLPEPEVNHVIRDQHGAWSRRLDLCYPDSSLSSSTTGGTMPMSAQTG